MSDPNEVCPSNWETYTSPIRACGNGQTSPNGGCGSVIYPAYGLRYTRVCGRVIGYQHSDTVAFDGLIKRATIEQQYLDGVSITHGGAGSRQHIWSFASAFGDAFVAQQPHSSCSCSSSNNWPYSTSFVGNDYFCDTGSHVPHIIFASDPLWDGAGCGPSSTCCTFNNPPWFCKTAPPPPPSPPLMTWRSGSVIAILIGTHLWRSLCNRCTCSLDMSCKLKEVCP